jgi:hypothetical protein
MKTLSDYMSTIPGVVVTSLVWINQDTILFKYIPEPLEYNTPRNLNICYRSNIIYLRRQRLYELSTESQKFGWMFVSDNFILNSPYENREISQNLKHAILSITFEISINKADK